MNLGVLKEKIGKAKPRSRKSAQNQVMGFPMQPSTFFSRCKFSKHVAFLWQFVEFFGNFLNWFPREIYPLKSQNPVNIFKLYLKVEGKNQVFLMALKYVVLVHPLTEYFGLPF